LPITGAEHLRRRRPHSSVTINWPATSRKKPHSLLRSSRRTRQRVWWVAIFFASQKPILNITFR